ncbi:DUF7322 domain-containing protein [Haloplanus sp.]|uniref:DUF7322 domain-containing protein n=1 Tax=Haloplanus sp. TaxID=1961696 RepID=UPI00261EB959|nr:hypothetical protein [Haloplanus sp.]
MLDPDSLLDDPEPTGELSESILALPAATLWAFVLAALLTQAGLLGASLGLMLVGFRGRWTVGGALIVVGTVALLGAVAIQRWHRTRTAVGGQETPQGREPESASDST